jgi:hypothetical protein
MASKNTDGPELEPGSTPVADVKPVTAQTDPTAIDPAQQSAYLDGIRKEYSQYVATSEIFWGTARAFNAGDPVPASHPGLEQWQADGLVEATGGAKGKR